MSNTLGKNIKVTLFGESHGPCIGAVLDGFPGGVKIDEDILTSQNSVSKINFFFKIIRNKKRKWKF